MLFGSMNGRLGKGNALGAGSGIRRRNNIQMASLHDDDAALAERGLSAASPFNDKSFHLCIYMIPPTEQDLIYTCRALTVFFCRKDCREIRVRLVE